MDLLNSNQKMTKMNENHLDDNIMQELRILLNRNNFLVKYDPFKNDDRTNNKKLY